MLMISFRTDTIGSVTLYWTSNTLNLGNFNPNPHPDLDPHPDSDPHPKLELESLIPSSAGKYSPMKSI